MSDPLRRARARTRLLAAVAAGFVLCAGLAVRGVADGEAAKYAGDALYTILLCTLVVLLSPATGPRVAGGIGLALSWAVECAQLTGVPAELAERSVLARLVLGSTFNAPDLLWYAVGAGLFLLIRTVVPRPDGLRHA
ncbi:ribosomal maturation YjgA family protein [Streptomyces sp. NPDC055287]